MAPGKLASKIVSGTVQKVGFTFVTMLVLSSLNQLSRTAAKPSQDAKSQPDQSVTISSNKGFKNFVSGGAFGDPYLSDFDEEWAKMSGRLENKKCVDIPAELSLCQGIGYEKMMLPNLLRHETMSEVLQQAKSWVPLVGLHCHPDTQVFLCSLFSPVCLDRRIEPCRTLCESVRDNCLHRMTPYGFHWPEMVLCDKFPEDNDLCIKLIHDVKPDNNCSACKHPLTYEAIIDNYCRAEFVVRAKIDGTEVHGNDRALILKKSKRFYKKENMTKQERNNLAPRLANGAACACNVINETSNHFLLMGGHDGDKLMVNYVVQFMANNKEFRRAFKDIRKDNVCMSIIEELSSSEVDQKTEKDDDRCQACRTPATYASLRKNFCLADFVLRAGVVGLESKDGQQTLVLKKKRKNFKKGAITRKEEKSMQPIMEGKGDCKCDAISNKKARYLIFGSKREDQFVVNYVAQFANKDRQFKKAWKAMRKGGDCLNLPELAAVNPGDVLPPNKGSPSAGKGKGKKKRKKGKKGRKGRKGKKGKKGKRKGKKGGKKKGGGKNSNKKKTAVDSQV